MRPFANNPRERVLDNNPYVENLNAQQIAAQYCHELGYPEPQPTPYVQVNPTVAKAIADIFVRTPNSPEDAAVREAYSALSAEVDAQFGILPVDVMRFGAEDYPYKTSNEMMDDILNHGRLAVYDGGDDHALLSREQNFKFRAVHDYFGHAAHGYAFGPRGEENAWIQHSKMFSPEARKAMTTETRGQNSYVNFGPYSYLPVKERPYAEQKVFILPPRYRTTPVLTEAYAGFPGFYPKEDLARNPLEEQMRPARGKAKLTHLFDTGKLTQTTRETSWCREPKRIASLKKFFEIGLRKFPDSYLWYNSTRDTLLNYFRGDTERTNFFIMLLAATSPLESVASNIELAFRALKLSDQHADEQTLRQAFPLPAHFENVWRVINGEQISGPKVVSFAKNLLGEPDEVTVDRWIIRAMLTDREFIHESEVKSERDTAKREALVAEKVKMERIGPALYRCMRSLIQDLAGQVGIEPRAFQAAAWAGVKDARGNIEADPPYPFEYYLHKYQAKEPELSFEASPEEQEFAEFEQALASNPSESETGDPFLDSGDGEFVL